MRVQAVGLNSPDWYLREGYSMLPPEWRPVVTMPVILGPTFREPSRRWPIFILKQEPGK